MKQRKLLPKTLTAILCVMMIVSALPISAFATSSTQFTQSQLSVVADKQSTLAPGVTENKYTVYDKNGDQVKLFVATADPSVSTVKMYASYLNMDPTNFGMSKLTEQAAAFNKKAAAGDPYYQGTVVAGINASYYNMNNGKPTGVFVMNGVDVTGGSTSAGYFAVMKDGSVKIARQSEYENDKGNIQEAIGIYTMLIVDGEICAGLDAKAKYPRQTIGITADGKVILMSADGNQAPTSVGLTVLEQAQVMKDLGCVWAGHLDGGGSMTYGSKPEGENSFRIVNNPTDGSERAISNGFLIVSTAAPSDIFDRAVLTAENDYVTPYSTVKVDASGVSPAGTAAEIPENAQWQLADTAFGTVENGVFTSTGKTGDAVVEMTVDGKVVGSVTIHVVVPELAFVNAEMTVPYEKTFALEVVGTTNGGMNKVALKVSDYAFELSDPGMGVINGKMFTTCSESSGITGGTITVKCVYDESKSDTATVNFGRASVIVEDFEDGDISGWAGASGYAPSKGPFGRLENGYVELVDANSGKVRNGNYAIALTTDCTECCSAGYKAIKFTFPAIDLTGATEFGMWMYLPVADVGYLEIDIGSYEYYSEKDAQVTEEGWYYISVPVSLIKKDSLAGIVVYMTDPNETYFNIFDKFTIFVDDLTLDYSNATDDRELPIFNGVKMVLGLDQETDMNGQTIAQNTITVTAAAAENLTGNYTGLDTSSARVFLDGVALTPDQYTCDSNGKIMISEITLSDGSHTFRFEIDDMAGNTGFITRKVVVKSQTADVSVVRRSNTVFPLAGSIEYFDVVARQIENVESVKLTIDLDSLNSWELQGADVLYGFEMTSSVDKFSNTATITLTKVGDVNVTGEQVIAALPVRVWQTSSYLMDKYINADRVTNNSSLVDSGYAATPYAIWQSDGVRLVRIEFNVISAVVRNTDNTVTTSAGNAYNVITEYNRYRANSYYDANGNVIACDANGAKQGKDSTHVHTANPLADKAATCTEAGYTGRTFCEVCNSVVDWGTTVPATGHTYDFVDGILQCTCGEKFTGTHTDGKDYVDGICQADGWVGDFYYKDGAKLTGVQLVPAPDGSGEFYYDFGTSGVCANRVKYTGLFYDESVRAYRFAKLGSLAGGWQQIDENWHYFKSHTKVAATGDYTINGVAFTFDETGMTKGAWHNDGVGTRYYYGPTYYLARSPGYMRLIEIEGETYNFDHDGYTTPGIQVLRESTAFKKYVYEFAEDGSLVRTISEEQIITVDGASYYINAAGYVEMGAGLFRYNGDYYFSVPSGKLKQNGNAPVTEANVAEYPELTAGSYFFGEDCKMVIPAEEPAKEDGIHEEDGIKVYYKDGVKQKNLGLVKVGDDFYYVCYSGKLKQNGYAPVTEANVAEYPELTAGSYFFGEDCKMVIPAEEPVKEDGIYEEDGVFVYYKDGAKQKNLGLVKVGDDFYYVCYSGKLKQNGYAPVTDANVTEYPELTAGSYFFGEDCKMVIPAEEPLKEDGIHEEDGIKVYYKDGVKQKNLGLIKVDGAYYYVCYSGKLKQNGYAPVTEANVAEYPELTAGSYFFGDDCKMVIK